LLLVLGAGIGAGLFLWQLWFAGDDEETQELQTVAVGRATIRATIATSGTAEAVDETELRFASAGRVEEILVTLGQEVKADVPLAVLESDDLENRLATAEVNLEVSRIRLRQLLKGADEAELLAAEQAIASAQAALSKGERDLYDVLEGPSEADLAAAEQTLASARSTLASAEAKLDALVQSPSPAEMASAQAAVSTAEQAVASAQSTRESAIAKLAQLQDSPSAAELASAEAAFTSAEANVTIAENRVDSAETTLESEEADLRSAGDAYCDAVEEVGRSDTLCPFSQVPLNDTSVDRLLEELSDPDKDEDLDCGEDVPDFLCPSLHDMMQGLVNANSSYVSAENAVTDAELNLGVAHAGLTSAQASLDALYDLPTQEDLSAAEAAVTAAEEGREAAEANLLSAKARVDDLAPSREDLEADRAAIDSAEEGVEAAEARLQELREGPDANDIQATEDAVRSAEANLNTAIANRDELLRGADPDDVALQRQQIRLAEIGVDEARKSLDDATLKAPYDGTVGGIEIALGDLVSSQLPAMTLLTPGALMVRLAIGETDLPSLHQGMVGLMLFDAVQGRPFPIVITAIGLEPKMEQGIVTYIVEGALVGLSEDADNRPVPGMNGSAMLVTEERRDVLSVPNRAIRRRGEDIVVELMVDGKPEIRPIEAGLSDTDNTEVLSGLEEGDLVVVPGTARADEEREEEQLPEGIR
jgi:RND family efflux transporter MFP subunit